MLLSGIMTLVLDNRAIDGNVLYYKNQNTSLILRITEIIKVAEKVKFYELHDRMLLSTVKFLKIPIISPDKKFKNLKGIEVIW